ncbi:TPA: ABC transporter permease [Candidatus Woesearchaeota archaeon]|nr:ABC transporter permease [Candidatus Woesearchaeota archaeon]
MDVEVAFEVDVSQTKTDADALLFDFSDMRSDVDGYITAITTGADNIIRAADQLESQVEDVNNTNVTEDVEAIYDHADAIKSDASELDTNIGLHSTEMVDKLTSIKNALSTVSMTVEEAETKVNSVKQKKDGLLPIFDSINKDINDMNTNVRILESTLDQALEKIDAIKVKDAEGIANPIKTEIKPISIQSTHFNSLFPLLLVLIIMITAVLLGSILVIGEKRSKAFFRNNLVPTSYFTFSLATYFTALSVLFIQLVLFVSVAAFFFETPVLASIWLILLIVFLIATLFIIIGMFIGFLFSTEATSTLASITVTSIFLLFSSTMLPTEAMGSMMRRLVEWNPFVISEMALKQTLLFNFGIEKLAYSLGMLGAYAVGLFVILIILQDVLRRLSFIQLNTQAKPQIVKEKKAESRLVPENPKVDNAANELLVEK